MSDAERWVWILILSQQNIFVLHKRRVTEIHIGIMILWFRTSEGGGGGGGGGRVGGDCDAFCVHPFAVTSLFLFTKTITIIIEHLIQRKLRHVCYPPLNFKTRFLSYTSNIARCTNRTEAYLYLQAQLVPGFTFRFESSMFDVFNAS